MFGIIFMNLELQNKYSYLNLVDGFLYNVIQNEENNIKSSRGNVIESSKNTCSLHII